TSQTCGLSFGHSKSLRPRQRDASRASVAPVAKRQDLTIDQRRPSERYRDTILPHRGPFPGLPGRRRWQTVGLAGAWRRYTVVIISHLEPPLVSGEMLFRCLTITETSSETTVRSQKLLRKLPVASSIALSDIRGVSRVLHFFRGPGFLFDRASQTPEAYLGCRETDEVMINSGLARGSHEMDARSDNCTWGTIDSMTDEFESMYRPEPGVGQEPEHLVKGTGRVWEVSWSQSEARSKYLHLAASGPRYQESGSTGLDSPISRREQGMND
ncbi:hypothetical protein SISNIDRAFT_536595, partial [Sistotremastrum niveocremeum HHB9708]